MAFIPAVNAARVEVRYLQDGQRLENTLWFAHGTSISPLELAALAAYVENWWNSEIKPLQASTVIYQETYAVDMTTESSGTATDNSLAGTAGTFSGAALPTNVTLAISFRTALRGRGARGRNYIIGMCEPSVTGNTVDSGYAGAWQAAYVALLDDPLTGWTWVVASFQEDNEPRAAALLIPITNVLFADLHVDSQRRRLTGRGT